MVAPSSRSSVCGVSCSSGATGCDTAIHLLNVTSRAHRAASPALWARGARAQVEAAIVQVVHRVAACERTPHQMTTATGRLAHCDDALQWVAAVHSRVSV